MGIVISVNGSAAGDGLLVAPDAGRTFSVPLSLSTDDGSTVSATINAAPNGAGVTLPGGAISIGPTATVISINATAVSNSRGDTVINVQVGAAKTTFSLTAITNPEIWFQGRFEVRFATDNDWYNDPKGTWGAGNDGTNPLGFGSQGPGYTFWLEGEPLFTPTGVDSLGVPLSVPTTIDKTGVGRVVRFNNPIAQRSHVAPIVTTVSGILGTLSGGGTTYFTAGDPVIGALVNVGPNTYLAQNWEPHSPPDPLPAESQAGGATFEPMALFECHIEGFFSGQPAIESPNPALDQRPRSTGYTGWVNDPASPISTTAGIPDFMTFSTTRQAALETDYGSLSAADQPTLAAGGAIVPGTGSAAGRNLVRRIQALSAVTGVAPSFGGTANRPGTDPQAWVSQEEYENGQVNDNITFLPNTSSVVAFLEGYTDFKYYNKLHTFHSDELCGFVYGSLQANSADRLAKTCIVQLQNSTFGKDQLKSIGLPATFPAAFWVVMDGFFPSELGIDATDNLTSPKNPPTVTFSVDPSNANQAAIINALQTMGQLTIEPFSGPVYTTTLPPAYAPQRILYPFTIQFTGTDGFIDETESLTLTATITVNGKTYSNSAPLVLTLAANPYVIDADGGNQYTTWLSTDLRNLHRGRRHDVLRQERQRFLPAGRGSGAVSRDSSSGIGRRHRLYPVCDQAVDSFRRRRWGYFPVQSDGGRSRPHRPARISAGESADTQGGLQLRHLPCAHPGDYASEPAAAVHHSGTQLPRFLPRLPGAEHGLHFRYQHHLSFNPHCGPGRHYTGSVAGRRDRLHGPERSGNYPVLCRRPGQSSRAHRPHHAARGRA